MDEFILTRVGLAPPMTADKRYPRVMIDSPGPAWREPAHADGSMHASFLEDDRQASSRPFDKHSAFHPVDVRLDRMDGRPFWWCVRGEVRPGQTPHKAYEEVLTVVFRSSLVNGDFPIESPMADVMLFYRLVFRDPPNYPDKDIHVLASATRGTLTLENDPAQHLLVGTFDNALVQVPALRPLIGVGPDSPYNLYINSGRFVVMRL